MKDGSKAARTTKAATSVCVVVFVFVWFGIFEVTHVNIPVVNLCRRLSVIGCRCFRIYLRALRYRESVWFNVGRRERRPTVF